MRKNVHLDNNFLQLDHLTMSERYTLKEIKKYLDLEPDSEDNIIRMHLLLEEFLEDEMYEYCAIVRDELDKRV